MWFSDILTQKKKKTSVGFPRIFKLHFLKVFLGRKRLQLKLAGYFVMLMIYIIPVFILSEHKALTFRGAVIPPLSRTISPGR